MTGNRSTQEDRQGMANVEDDNISGRSGPGAGTIDRVTRGDRGGLKAGPREDDDPLDPAEYARLLDVYDSSFRNIAEGEVVKGTVLKVTPSEVIVDVGYKSEGMIALTEFLDENGRHRPTGRHRRRPARAHRGSRRVRRLVARKSREDEDLGRGREGLRRAQGRDRPGHR